MFISDDLQSDLIAEKIQSLLVEEPKGDWIGKYMTGGFLVEDFLSEVGRQFLEGQIFAYGADLREVCRTVSSPFCPDEITIPQPEKQIPVIGDFAAEFDAFSEAIFPHDRKQTAYQLRVYEPNYGGHPKHVDYEPGFAIREQDNGAKFTTSLSFSLPISWNNGAAPVFEIYEEEGVIQQDRPGSLAIFGPKTLHAHPSAPDLASNYAWLIAQVFYEGEAKEAACEKIQLKSLTG